MATANVTLVGGLQIGDTVHTEATLREPTAQDLIDALEESEKLIMVPSAGGDPEPRLVTSPGTMGFHVLRRQIVRIGDHPGPLTLAELKRLKSAADIDLLQAEALKLEQASLEALVKQGRPGAGGQGAD
mgnify:CR=1 FL=1